LKWIILIGIIIISVIYWKKFHEKAYQIFIGILGDANNKTSKNLFILFKFAIYATIIVLLINIFFNDFSKLGEWGDFFGGTLNPLLTFLTFMGLLITIVLQQSELKESRKEFKRSADALFEQSLNTRKQSFESTFFQMISIHNDLVNSIDLQSKNGNLTQGRDCFNTFYTRLNKQYRDDIKNYMGGGQSDKVVLEHTYKTFWKYHQTELGHYYRYLYNVVRFVSESNYDDGPYIRLIRAQLSDQELLMLFYNSTSEYGRNFKKYIEQYALLDNMPEIRLLNSNHKDLLNKSAYGN